MGTRSSWLRSTLWWEGNYTTLQTSNYIFSHLGCSWLFFQKRSLSGCHFISGILMFFSVHVALNLHKKITLCFAIANILMKWIMQETVIVWQLRRSCGYDVIRESVYISTHSCVSSNRVRRLVLPWTDCLMGPLSKDAQDLITMKMIATDNTALSGLQCCHAAMYWT